MYLFKPIEVEIKTGWTKRELISKFHKAARLTNDGFTLDSNPIGYNALSFAQGTITTSDDLTLVSIKIFPTMFLNAFALLWHLFTAAATINYLVKGLLDMDYNSGIHIGLLFWVAGFVTTQLSFRSSAEVREKQVRQIMRS